MNEIAEYVSGESLAPDASRQDKLTESLRDWAQAHADKHEQITVLENNPRKYPEQLPTTYVTRERNLAKILPERVVTSIKRYIVAKNVGYKAIKNFELAFKNSHDGTDIAEDLGEVLREGQNVILLTGHAQQLFDLAYAHTSANIVANSHRGGIFLNKAMAWEAYNGRPITNILSYIGDINWVVPDTDSAKDYEVPRNGSMAINSGAMKQFWSDLDEAKQKGRGRIVSVVPSGTSMIVNTNEDGSLSKLIMPPTSKTTKGVLAKADYILPVAVYGKDMMRVGDLTSLENFDRPERIGIISRAIGQLATMTSELAEVPCEVLEA